MTQKYLNLHRIEDTLKLTKSTIKTPNDDKFDKIDNISNKL